MHKQTLTRILDKIYYEIKQKRTYKKSENVLHYLIIKIMFIITYHKLDSDVFFFFINKRVYRRKLNFRLDYFLSKQLIYIFNFVNWIKYSILYLQSKTFGFLIIILYNLNL